MKILSGNFLSQVLALFKRANRQQWEKSQIIDELMKICEEPTIQVDLNSKFLKSSSIVDESIIQKQRQVYFRTTAIRPLRTMLT